MILEAEAADCCSTTFVLKVDGRPIGKYEGRWFSESLDIDMMGRRHLSLEKIGWLSSEFHLKDQDGEVLARADRAGIFTSAWDLTLSVGVCQLIRDGWFTSAFVVQQGDTVLARVDRRGICDRGWTISGNLNEVDLMLAGLIYHVIIQREARQRQHHGHAGT